MTSKKPLLGVGLAGLLVLSGVAAAGVAGSIAEEATENDLAVAVENVGNDGATVTVTQNESTVADAEVTVDTVDEKSYAGTGTYATDENGTVSLPDPETDVTVEVTAEKGNATESTTATITAGGESDSGEENGSFGRLVSSFVHELLNAGDHDGPLGQHVSEFVTQNNPGNATENSPSHAGKPDHAGPNDEPEQDETGTDGNETDDDDARGPPDHANNDENDDRNETDDEDDDADDDENDESDRKGNNGNGNGHGK